MLRIDMLLNFLECLLIGDSITAIKKLKNCSVLVNYVSGTLFTILSNKYDNNKEKKVFYFQSFCLYCCKFITYLYI